MAATMDTILMKMLKIRKVTDGHTDEGWTMVNRPRHKLTLSKAPGELTIEDLQDGCCGYCNKMFLAILNLHVAPMPSTKFWFNQTYHWEHMRFDDFQDGHLGGHLSQILDQTDFGNSESLCRSDASHQVWVQSILCLGRRCHLKKFKMATVAPASWLSK